MNSLNTHSQLLVTELSHFKWKVAITQQNAVNAL